MKTKRPTPPEPNYAWGEPRPKPCEPGINPGSDNTPDWLYFLVAGIVSIAVPLILWLIV